MKITRYMGAFAVIAMLLVSQLGNAEKFQVLAALGADALDEPGLFLHTVGSPQGIIRIIGHGSTSWFGKP